MAQTSKEHKRQMRLADRRALIWDLFKAGHSYRQISAELLAEHDIRLHFTDVGKEVRAIVATAKAHFAPEEIETHRRVQLDRIQQVVKDLWTRIAAGDGSSIDRLIRLMEREARLLGLDAPAKVDITGRLRALAEAEGVAPEEAIRTAENIVREAAARRG